MVDSSTADIFARIYRLRSWGDDESRSGPGSGLARTEAIRADLAALVRSLGVRTLLDAGCGDFHWMQACDLGLASYIGVDIVDEVVRACAAQDARQGYDFECLDITRDPLPRVDLILCRDVLPHFSYADIHRALDNFVRSGSTWLLTNTFVDRDANADIATGDWRPINLERAPFLLPAPSFVIDERCHHTDGIYRDKRLALWDVRSSVESGFSRI
jgi:SAM-dependent methyltransferase